MLTPVKTTGTRPQRNRRPSAASPVGTPDRDTHGPHYRLADYLDQHGRHRADQIPPIDFWNAAATYAHAADLTGLGNAAWSRGLYRDAAQLYKQATAQGIPQAASLFVDRLHILHPFDHRPVQLAATRVALHDPHGVAALLGKLSKVGAEQQAMILAQRAATHMLLDDPQGLRMLLMELRWAGAEQQALALAKRAATHTAVDDLLAVAALLS
ncbi:hypothetical protein [Streptomyces sp. NPDC060027]|uniref:hypothetical protein n=1 Tax=Streptomyces sp. NPDC060027 TaxID=3347040 RepID=UPI0036816175